MRKKLQSMLAIAQLAAAFAGCGPPAEKTPEFDILDNTRPVPIVAAQAVVLNERASTMMNSTGGAVTMRLGDSDGSTTDLHMATLTAEDFDGRPFVHVTFSAPVPIDDPLSVGLSLDPKAWANAVPDSQYTTSFGGATDARGTLTLTRPGLDLMIQLANTARTIGRSRIKRIVAPMPTDLLFEDVDGKYYQAKDGLQLTLDAIAQKRDDYNQSHKANNDPKLKEALAQSWASILDSVPGSDAMASFTNADGTLNMNRAVQALKDQGASSGDIKTQRLEPAPMRCRQVLWWKACDRVEIGRLSDPSRLQGHHPIQLTQSFTPPLPKCLPWSTELREQGVQRAPNGCGPAAFTSLVWREWADGAMFYGKQFNGESPSQLYRSDSIAQPMLQDVPRMMNSCIWAIDSTATWPATGFLAGGNRWLSQYGGQSMHLRASISYTIIDNWFTAGEKANVLRERIGRDRGPVVALYWPEGIGHYSPVTAYKIIYGPLGQEVFIETMDDPDTWSSLHDPWLATGVFYIEH